MAKAGRPKREFSDATVKKIADYAVEGCSTRTIAALLDVPEKTLRDNFPALLSKKRAERRYNLRVAQNKAANAGNPAILIFLGKNELGQTDKQEINAGKETLAALFRTADKEHKANGTQD